ncbi:MAG: PqqD family peptide modification chaperone [Frankiales bacterium]|nr:PqqD family peptide modification chaperone [Frankiales bacterium]
MSAVPHDVEVEGRRPASLGLSDRPRLSPDVGLVVLDGEGVLLHAPSGATHLLSPSATVVVQCLDGSWTLAETCRELAEATGAAEARIGEDVLGLVQDLGRKGLLAGVQAEPVHAHPQTTGLPVGTPLTGLSARLTGGRQVDDAWLAGADTLVVSWSAGCGWCSRLAPDLAQAAPRLAATGTRVLLLTTSDHAAVAAQLGDAAAAVLVGVAEDGLPSWYAGLGTPVAYVVRGGLTAGPLAHGAVEVGALLLALPG